MTAPELQDPFLDPQWIAVKKKLAAGSVVARLATRSRSKPASRRDTTPTPIAGGAWLAGLLPQLEQLRAPVDRLEQLERELLALMPTAAPATWEAHRRKLRRILGEARREMRSREHQPLIGDLS